MLKKLTLLRERVPDWQAYPFSVPAIQGLNELIFRSRVCFFSGENGTGKSTLLEAIGAHYGFGREGGNRNFQIDTTESNHSIDALVKALRLSFDNRTGAGFFLRAESFSTPLRILTQSELPRDTAVEVFILVLTVKLFLLFSTTNSDATAYICSTNLRRHYRLNVNCLSWS